MRATLWMAGTLTVLFAAPPDKGGLPLAKVDVTEPKQTALIAFDGSTEVLYISSVLRPKEKTRILEILPLPGEPTVELADARVIDRAAAVYNARVQKELERRARQRRREALQRTGVSLVIMAPILTIAIVLARRGHRVTALLTMLFGVFFLFIIATPGMLARSVGAVETTVEVLSQQQLGPHSITVVKTREPADISAWVEELFRKEGGDPTAFDQGWRDLLESYVRNGCPYFAVDLIDADPASGPIAPLRYTFPAKAPWFPLRISSRGHGASDILLMLLLPGENVWKATFEDQFHEVGRLYRGFDMSPQELKSIDSVLEDRFKSTTSKLYAVRFQRRLEDLKADFVLKAN